MKLRKLLAAGLCAAMVFSLAACGGSSNDGGSASGSTEAGGEKEVYVVATEPTYAPFELTEEDGTISGFDVDILEAIAEDQGFELEWSALAFDALFPSLKSGACDMVIAAIAETPERMENADFTLGYYLTKKCLMVTEDNPANSIDELDPSTKAGVQIGTVIVDRVRLLKEEGTIADYTELNDFATCIMQLQNDDIQAIAADHLTIEGYMAENSGYKDIGDITFENDEADFNLRIAVKKGNTELQEKLDAGLTNIMENGTYQDICDKWGMEALSEPAQHIIGQ